MELKIEDVAQLLSVSKETVKRWVEEKKIPSYRIGNDDYFDSFTIENWVMDHEYEKIVETEDVKNERDALCGNLQFSFYRALFKGGVFNDVPGNTVEDIVRHGANLVSKRANLDEEMICSLLLEREKLQPTALNNGIAVPHARDCYLSTPHDVIGVVFPENPIPFGALDGKNVHTLFFLFASEDKRHLHLLSKIAHLSSQKESLEFLKCKPTKPKLLGYIKQWETQIHH